MARARLHVICGNCGCNDMFTHEIVKDFHDYGDHQEDGVVLMCGNCTTLHDLSDTVPEKKDIT